jgi:hypothetical protein
MALDIQNMVEIEYTVNLSDLIPTLYAWPVFRYLLWENTPSHIPAITSDQRLSPFDIANIQVEGIDQSRVSSIAAVWSTQQTYTIIDNYLYLHITGNQKVTGYITIKFGVYQGFTDRGVMTGTKGGNIYTPRILALPVIEESADPLSYGKMEFMSGAVDLLNTDGKFDVVSQIFGNEMRIMTGPVGTSYDSMRKMIQYYIGNVVLSREKMTVDGRDKRERLSEKAPVKVYTVDEFPYMATPGYAAVNLSAKKSKNLGKVMANAYGTCINVPGVCTNEYQVYTDLNNLNRNQTRMFRFADGIASVTDLQAKMSGDTWTQIPQNSGVIIYADGRAEIPIRFIFPADSSGAPDPGKSVYEVRMSGIFVNCPAVSNMPANTPGPIILKILRDYANLPISNDFYDLTEMNNNLRGLPPVGIALTSSKALYDWIETLQNSSVLGFKWYNNFNLFSARLDNSNRTTSFEIKAIDILNRDGITVDYRLEDYASYAKIRYNYDVQNNEYESVIVDQYQRRILENYRVAKEYGEEAPTLLLSKTYAEDKGKIVMNEYLNFRPIIRGVEVFGDKWFARKFYDTGYIDLTETIFADNKNYLVQLLNNREKNVYGSFENKDHEMIDFAYEYPDKIRAFLGRVRVKILRRSVDLNTYITTFDLQVCEVNAAQAASYGGST